MTLERLQHLYKKSGYIIAGLSLMIILIPLAGATIQERIWQVLIVNLGYHLFYYLISTAPLIQLNWLEANSITRAMAMKIFFVMSYFIVGACGITAIAITYIALSNNSYGQLIAIAGLPGFIFGAIKLNLRLRKINNKRSTTTE